MDVTYEKVEEVDNTDDEDVEDARVEEEEGTDDDELGADRLAVRVHQQRLRADRHHPHRPALIVAATGQSEAGGKQDQASRSHGGGT